MTSIDETVTEPEVDIERLTRLVQDALAERVAQSEGRGERFDEEDRHQFALTSVTRELTDISQGRIRGGQRPLTPAVRKVAAGAVLRRVFSLLPELEAYLENRR